MSLSKEEVSEVLAANVKEMERLLAESVQLADEHGLHFSMSLGDAENVSRRIGGDYYGKGNTEHDGVHMYNGWDASEVVEEGSGEHDGFWEAWQSSSEMC